MREIKFRAWWKDAKMMEDVVKWGDGEISILVPLKPNSLGQKYELQQLDEGQYELMQFTGLKDKNSKEIYEGDILKGNGDWSNPAIVEFEGGGFHGTGGYKHMGHSFFKELEIIGNIYENPELLTKAGDGK